MPLFLSLMFFSDVCVFFSLLSFSSLFYLYFLSWFSPPPFHYSQLWSFILSTMTGFTIFTSQPLLAHCGHPSKTAHWPVGYPNTTTTLCWLHHASFPNKSGFVLSLISLNTLIRIRVKPLPYQPLWHASSDSSSCLFLLDEMSS